jgi:hypothetical protein
MIRVEKILLEIGSEESAAAVRRYVAQMGDVKEVSWPAPLPGETIPAKEDWRAIMKEPTAGFDSQELIHTSQLNNQLDRLPQPETSGSSFSG